jgi:hypothetical protein
MPHSVRWRMLVRYRCNEPSGANFSQAPDRSDILNVGGFSGSVFQVVASFLSDDAGRFVAEVEAVEL